MISLCLCVQERRAHVQLGAKPTAENGPHAWPGTTATQRSHLSCSGPIRDGLPCALPGPNAKPSRGPVAVECDPSNSPSWGPTLSGPTPPGDSRNGRALPHAERKRCAFASEECLYCMKTAPAFNCWACFALSATNLAVGVEHVLMQRRASTVKHVKLILTVP